jgi:MoaA/NifB/PqqE/SkfB family radical SAM enzyme
MIIDFNITNFCNAKCPTCKRFDVDNYLQLTPGLKLVHMELKEFEFVLDKNRNFFYGKICYFCGEFGDPLMHPFIKEFAQLANKVFKEVVVYTNGGLNRKDFFDYSILPDNNVTIRFGIDGLTSESNNKYRIDVNTDLAYKNMFYVANHKKTLWDFTLFEHNKHEIEDIIKLVDEHSNLFLNIRCNLRPDFHGVNRIKREDYDAYCELANKYFFNDRVTFDKFWVDCK